LDTYVKILQIDKDSANVSIFLLCKKKHAKKGKICNTGYNYTKQKDQM